MALKMGEEIEVSIPLFPPNPQGIGRRRFIAGAGLASILASGRAPALAQGAAPKKLVYAHITAPPESAASAFDWMAKEVEPRSKGALVMEFHGGTLLTKELEIMNAGTREAIGPISPLYLPVSC